MPDYHLDTDTCAAALKGHREVQSRCLQYLGRLRVSSIVVGELYTAVYRSRRTEQNLSALCDFLSNIGIVPFDEQCAKVYGRICADLLNRGLPTGEKDALIAAVAQAHGAVLVTHNTRHYSNIAGLDIDDWVDS